MGEDGVKARIDAYIRRLDDSIKEGQKKFKSLTFLWSSFNNGPLP